MHMVIAVLVLGFSLVCALLVFQRGMIDRSETGSRRWIIAAGIVTGLGVWATHFIALLGYKPGFPVTFDVFVTLMSALVAVMDSRSQRRLPAIAAPPLASSVQRSSAQARSS